METVELEGNDSQGCGSKDYNSLYLMKGRDGLSTLALLYSQSYEAEVDPLIEVNLAKH